VQSGLAGYAVIKVTKITPGSTPSLESMRPQLEEEAKARAAKEKAYESAKKYGDAQSNGASVADAAKAAGATPVSFGPVTAQGQDMTGHPIADADPKILKEAFTLAQGAETALEEEGNGEYYAFRVEKVTPATLPPLADLKPRLTQGYMQQAIADALNARAAALVKAIKGGQSLEAAAADAKTKVAPPVPTISRFALAQSNKIDQGMIDKLFSAKKGDVITGQVGPVQVMVARIDAVQPANTDQAAHATVAQAGDTAKQIFQDMVADARTMAVSKVKPTYDLAGARTALGLTADQLPKAGAKPSRGPAP
jgi:peptidyl-prolyl cis-trans isomerase D